MDTHSVPDVKLIEKADGWYVSMNVSSDWKSSMKRRMVTTSVLDKAIVPDQAFTNPDGSRMKVDRDYFGNKRSSNPFPGAIEVKNSGFQEWKVWSEVRNR